jgi:hypothetical protein
MGNSLYISTTESGSGKALVALGTIELILRKATKVSFFRPVIQTTQIESKSGNLLTDRDEDIELILQHFGLPQTYAESFGLRADLLNDLLGQHQLDRVLSIIIEKFQVLVPNSRCPAQQSRPRTSRYFKSCSGKLLRRCWWCLGGYSLPLPSSDSETRSSGRSNSTVFSST